MRLLIHHQTRYEYDAAPRGMIDVLRLTPCSTATQTVRGWHLDVSPEVHLDRGVDAFGNQTHTFTVDRPIGEVVITATGTIDTEAHEGVVAGTFEPLPVPIYLRETDRTAADTALAALGRDAKAASDGTPLDVAHTLNRLVHERMAFEPRATDAGINAADALGAGAGACQDLTHVFLAAARSAGLPARYVSGYHFVEEAPREGQMGHAWAEVAVPNLGWVSFDPATARSPDGTYVRVAVALDALGASPVRGAVYGGTGESLGVDVVMERVAHAATRYGRTQEGWPGAGTDQ